jgi:hypothetical protein
MEVGLGYLVCNCECDVCNYKWVGVVEVDCIYHDDYTEYKRPDKLQCNKCSSYTTNFYIEKAERDAIKIQSYFFMIPKKKQREILRLFLKWSIKHYIKTLFK